MPVYSRVRVGVGWTGWYVLQVKVETQNFASHKEVCVCLPVYFRVCMLVWGGRETQECVCLPMSFRVCMLVWGGRETQDFASLLLGMRC